MQDKERCPFCHYDDLAVNVLKETPTFLIVADHAPLVEGHLLIIPKQHYSCYGAVPAELDADLHALKHEVEQFLGQYYAPVFFWEHGVFRQTVFHAHLHCLPFGAIEYDLSQELHSAVVHTQEDIRRWYTSQGEYFYMENVHNGFLFAPEADRYLQIIKTIFARGVASRGVPSGWRSPQQRYEEGVPLIKAVATKWHTFQQLSLS